MFLQVAFSLRFRVWGLAYWYGSLRPYSSHPLWSLQPIPLFSTSRHEVSPNGATQGAGVKRLLLGSLAEGSWVVMSTLSSGIIKYTHPTYDPVIKDLEQIVPLSYSPSLPPNWAELAFAIPKEARGEWNPTGAIGGLGNPQLAGNVCIGKKHMSSIQGIPYMSLHECK